MPAPTTEEVQALMDRLSQRVEAWLAREGFGEDEVADEDDDSSVVLLAASVAGRVAHGQRAGARVRRLRRAHERPFRLPPLCGEARGYNLHAGVVIAAKRREGLERLCRYVLRPPLARTRLHRRPDGLLVLSLRRPYSDGTTEFIAEVELAEKLAALIPPARKNTISYHGVLAPRHAWRRRVVPKPPKEEGRERLTKAAKKPGLRWHARADLLWRVFEIDGLAYRCGRRLVLQAVVLPPATLDVLESLERSGALNRGDPEPANAQPRAPPEVA